jgi:hypothetical protein
MKNIFSVFLVASLLSCATMQWMAGEKEDFSELIYSFPPSGHLDFEKDPKFSAIVDELKYWIVHTRYDNEGNEIDKLDDRNHFCAVGYKFPPNVDGDERFYIEKEVVVYWIEKGMSRVQTLVWERPVDCTGIGLSLFKQSDSELKPSGKKPGHLGEKPESPAFLAGFLWLFGERSGNKPEPSGKEPGRSGKKPDGSRKKPGPSRQKQDRLLPAPACFFIYFALTPSGPGLSAQARRAAAEIRLPRPKKTPPARALPIACRSCG